MNGWREGGRKAGSEERRWEYGETKTKRVKSIRKKKGGTIERLGEGEERVMVEVIRRRKTEREREREGNKRRKTGTKKGRGREYGGGVRQMKGAR